MRPNKIRRWTIVCIELLVGIEKKGQYPPIKITHRCRSERAFFIYMKHNIKKIIDLSKIIF